MITVADVAEYLGRSRASARRLLWQLEADGLKRKGKARGTHYITAEFLAAYEQMDTRPQGVVNWRTGPVKR